MSYREAKLEVDTQLGDGFISSMKDGQKAIKDKVSELKKYKNIIKDNLSGNKEDNSKESGEESSEVKIEMKSEIYMAGTSMGSYDKPMMKGSELKMCGSQVGKHMKR